MVLTPIFFTNVKVAHLNENEWKEILTIFSGTTEPREIVNQLKESKNNPITFNWKKHVVYSMNQTLKVKMNYRITTFKKGAPRTIKIAYVCIISTKL